MSFRGFERRKPTKPKTPLEAVIEMGDAVTGGFVENLSLDGLFVRLKNRHLKQSGERVKVDLFLAASNGPSIFMAEARIARVDEAGVALQFRPMPLRDHKRLKAIIAFISPDIGSEGEPASE
jgi:hypothetical protein